MSRVLRYLIPSAAFFGYTFAFRMFYAFTPLYFKRLGFAQEHIGVLMAVHPLTLILIAIPLGMVSDRLSPRTGAISGLVILSVSVFALRQCTGFYEVLAAFGAAGAGLTLFTVNTSSLYFKSLGNARHGAKLALINSITHIAYGFGPLTGSIILGSGGHMHTLFLLAAVIIMSCAPIMRAVPDVRLERFPPSMYLEDLADRRKWFMFAMVFVFCLHFGAENVCYSLFLKYNCGLPDSKIGFVFMAVGLALAPAAVATGLMSDRLTKINYLMAAGIALSGVFNAAMFFAHSLWTVIPIRVGHALGDGIFLTCLDVYVSRMFPPRRIGAPIGMRDMIKTTGTLCGSLLAGFLPGYELPFVLTGLVSVALLPFVLRYFKAS